MKTVLLANLLMALSFNVAAEMTPLQENYFCESDKGSIEISTTPGEMTKIDFTRYYTSGNQTRIETRALLNHLSWKEQTKKINGKKIFSWSAWNDIVFLPEDRLKKQLRGTFKNTSKLLKIKGKNTGAYLNHEVLFRLNKKKMELRVRQKMKDNNNPQELLKFYRTTLDERLNCISL